MFVASSRPVRRLLRLASNAAGLLAFTAFAFAQNDAQIVVPDRITQPVNPNIRVMLKHNVHPLVQARFDEGAAPGSQSTGRIMLVLKRSDAQETALRQFLSDVQNPASPSYRKWLTPERFGKLYGPSDADLTTVTAWLQSQGFTVDKVPQARNVVIFSGNFAQVQQAFHTTIHRYLANGETHFANATDPQIPAALAPVVGGIASLNDFRPKPGASVRTTAHFNPETKRIEPDLTLHDQQGNNYLFVNPADAATIYDTTIPALNPKYTGTTYDGYGINIGIVGVSNLGCGDCTSTDVDNYRNAFLPPSYDYKLPYNAIVDGNDPGVIPGGAAIEALLDNEVAGGIAPGAIIDFYIAADTDIQSGLFLAIYRALDDNLVSILNVSFGECEAFLGASGNLQILNAWEQAAAQGISVTVSTGDSGSAGCDSDTQTIAKNGLAVNGLASTPYNIAVGGTDYNALSGAFTLYVNTSNAATSYYRTALGYIPENPWNNSTTYNNGSYSLNAPYNPGRGTNIVGGGGGVSSCTQSMVPGNPFSGNTGTCPSNSGYPQPSFQSGIVPASLFPGGIAARALPDVSFLAANGKYNALWVICADATVTGTSTPGPDCQNTNGQFTSGATFTGVGGTSASAPAFAGMLALISQSQGGARLGQADYVLYNLAGQSPLYGTIFHDITAGNNSVYCQPGSPDCSSNSFLAGYDAGSGYDAATGLGSIDLAQLTANWSKAVFSSSSTTLTLNGAGSAINVQHGTPLTFTASVSPNNATGDVAIINNHQAFYPPLQDGGFAIGPNGENFLTLSNGTASGTSNMLPGGTYAVMARYGGDNTYTGSTSGGVLVNILPEPSSTLLSLDIYDPSTGHLYTGSNTSIPYGLFNFTDAQPVCSGCIAANGKITSDGAATGTVTFRDGSTTVLGFQIAVASNGVATVSNYQNPGLSFAVGSHNVTAEYSGDHSFNASTSGAVSFTIAPAGTNTTVSSSATSVGSSASVTIGVTVSANSIGVPPSGAVQLYNGSTAIGGPVALMQGYSPTTGLAQSTAGISLTGSQLAAVKTAKLERPAFPWGLSGGATALACVLFFAIPARRRSWRSLLVLIAAAVVVSSIVACGGGSGSSNGGGGGGSSTTATITAKYSGDTNYTASTSAAVTVTVTK